MAIEPTISSEPRVMGNRTRSSTDLDVTGMTCGNCARHVNQALQGVRGVQSATVDLDSHLALVRWAPGAEPDVPALLQAVEAEGFGAKVIEHAQTRSEESGLAGWKLNLFLGVPVTALLMLGEWVLGLGMARWFHWVAFVLAGVVQIFAGARFYRGAWNQLKARSSNMDTLVALGSTTAFGYSTWALFTGYNGHVYFMEAAAIITLISLGHWAESRVSLRASSALRDLLNLAPAVARQRLPDGKEVERPVAELTSGDLVVLRPGDHVPTDGEVVEGSSAIDEAMLTGESVPVDKSAGSLLFAGTVNLNGSLLMRVTATGEETALAHIIAAVERAQNSRAEIQRVGDRVSNVFVPVVVGVAVAAALWWGFAPESARLVHDWLGQFAWPVHVPEGRLAAALITAAAVLIISCPCAMGLATPAAIMASANAAAQRGILIRDGVALEKAGQVTAVIFDKTGTLTTGKPTVADTWQASAGHGGAKTSDAAAPNTDPSHRSIAALAAALASRSSHPVSQAVAKSAADVVPLSDWQEVHGSGVQARVEGKASGTAARQSPNLAVGGMARLGSLRWLKESGVALGPAEAFIARWSDQGSTIVGLAVDQELLGLFAVKDTIKAGAASVVAELHRQQLKTFMVTGDNALTAAGIARLVGIAPEHVFSEVRPEQKAEFVKRLQAQGERVAFVGDGINDAPALEHADLGIAVSRASDIAREAADIILLKSEIEAVPESLGLARATLRTIKQNLFWAFFYNIIGIPLAALGFMSPILCAAAMGLSDLVVIGNALRLRHWQLPRQVRR